MNKVIKMCNDCIRRRKMDDYIKGVKLLLLNENMYQQGYISQEYYQKMDLEIHRKYLNHIVMEDVVSL